MKQSPDQKPDWNIVRMLEWATGYLSEKEVPSPRLSIEWLLAHVLNVKRLDLYLQFDRPLRIEELNRLKPLILRRANMEPLQYITGSTDFYNVTVKITKDVLIPRPETEQLVELILQHHNDAKEFHFLDVGTGSGCIALAVKKARPLWKVTAIDNCEKALQIARDNARDNNLEVTFCHASYENYESDVPVDIIASNPPYIEEHEIPGLAEQVIAYEPRNALITKSVSDVYRQLMHLCKRCLEPGGSFYFEINESSGDNVLKLCNIAPFYSRLSADYNGKDRFLIGKFE